jgi:hypothetical protein
VRVRYCRGGLWVSAGGHALAIDAPAGLSATVGNQLSALSAVVLTSGRARAVGGLVELLEAVAGAGEREHPLVLHVPFGEERGAALADLWVQHWAGRYPLTLDSERPGSRFQVGPLEVTTLPIRSGEPVWATGTVSPKVGVGVEVLHRGRRLVALLGAAPEPALERYCADADWLVVEVGVTRWPRTEVPWRLRADQAVALGRTAKRLWIVGDDGRRLRTPMS